VERDVLAAVLRQHVKQGDRTIVLGVDQIVRPRIVQRARRVPVQRDSDFFVDTLIVEPALNPLRAEADVAGQLALEAKGDLVGLRILQVGSD
jgi:hypothetical protein